MKKYLLGIITVFVVFFFSGCVAKIATAASIGDIKTIEKELNNGVDINTLSLEYTPISWAAHNGQLEAVKYLVEHGAKIDAAYPDSYWAPLHAASIQGHLDVVKYLVEQGADVNINNAKTTNDHWGATPLHMAANKGYFKIVKYLSEHGADLSLLDNDGKTPIESASDSKIISYLQQHAKKDRELYLKKQEEKLALKKEKEHEDKLKKEVDTFLKNNDFEGLKKYTDENPDSVYYIFDDSIRLLFTGPAGMKVGDIRKLINDGKSEFLVVSLIKRVKVPYKEFTLDEIDLLIKMGLSEKIIATMIDVTTEILKDKEKREYQEFLLSEQKRMLEEQNKAKVIYQAPNTQSNGIGDQIKDELIKQGVKQLFEHLF
ncbi:ankyrin repeat domain-containing protein [Sulfurimonas sp.]|uniref:ankyrin repeat domain-containing protein n=1 Tax=Sulfurimonas sp. TaxID=2022749 RepID=UPI0035667972